MGTSTADGRGNIDAARRLHRPGCRVLARPRARRTSTSSRGGRHVTDLADDFFTVQCVRSFRASRRRAASSSGGRATRSTRTTTSRTASRPTALTPCRRAASTVPRTARSRCRSSAICSQARAATSSPKATGVPRRHLCLDAAQTELEPFRSAPADIFRRSGGAVPIEFDVGGRRTCRRNPYRAAGDLRSRDRQRQ